jgi:hypothetical protein
MYNKSKFHQQAIQYFGVLSVSFILNIAPVLSDTTVSLSSTVTPSEISGFSGTSFTLGSPKSTHGLNGLWSVERNDKPCYVASMTEDINNSSDDSGAHKDLCGAKATSSEIKAQFGDIKFANRTFIRAVRVCMNKDNDRVKGFQVRGREIDSNGNVSNLPARYPDSSGSSGVDALVDLNAPYVQRSNCDGWKKWAECPEGQIATALIAHFGPGSNPRSLIGIALQCQGVRKG